MLKELYQCGMQVKTSVESLVWSSLLNAALFANADTEMPKACVEFFLSILPEILSVSSLLV